MNSLDELYIRQQFDQFQAFLNDATQNFNKSFVPLAVLALTQTVDIAEAYHTNNNELGSTALDNLINLGTMLAHLSNELRDIGGEDDPMLAWIYSRNVNRYHPDSDK